MRSGSIPLDEGRRVELRRLEEREIDGSDPDSPEVEKRMKGERGRFYRPVKQSAPRQGN